MLPYIIAIVASLALIFPAVLTAGGSGTAGERIALLLGTAIGIAFGGLIGWLF